MKARFFLEKMAEQYPTSWEDQRGYIATYV